MLSTKGETAPIATGSISSPPTVGELFSDKMFRQLTVSCAWFVVLLVVYILYEIGGKALPAISEHGTGFLTATSWDVKNAKFGVLPQIWGTLYSSMLALLIGGFFGVTMAIFLTQGFLPHQLQIFFKNIVELLAAIPSVVYGLWGIFVLIPIIRPVADWLNMHFGWIPFFSTTLSGPGMLPAAIVLSIMILPTVAAISQDALLAIPHKTREAAYGMGTTRWEAILRVMLPTAANGIFGALVLGLGRALGETMALAMLVGNSNQISLSLFSPANTLAALLALNFPEAGKNETQVLMYAAIILLIITLIVNVIGQFIITYANSSRGTN